MFTTVKSDCNSIYARANQIESKLSISDVVHMHDDLAPSNGNPSLDAILNVLLLSESCKQNKNLTKLTWQ